MKWMCSADAHFTEPGDLWTSRMPASMRDDAPGYVIEDEMLSYSVLGKEFMKLPAAALLEFGEIGDDVPTRLELLDQDEIWAETLIGNVAGLIVLSFEDPEFAMATARAFNDYCIETFGPYRDREIALGMVPVRDVDLAVKEIERVASLGLRGITLPLEPHEPYYLEKFEPIWAAAAEHGLPISFHATTGGDFTQKFSLENVAAFFGGTEREQQAKKTFNGMKFGNDSFSVVSHLIGAGVLERYPELHLVFVETNAGWLASAMEAMDAEWAVRPAQERATASTTYGGGEEGEDVSVPMERLMGGGWPYPLTPSEYVRRQVHATFQNETAALKFREYIGIEPLLWGSDFPHPEGTWPHTRKVVDELFADVPEVERDAILGGTLAKIYGIEVPAG